MTTIKASCPTCGEVELTPADVALMVCSHAPLSYYAFCCPTCSEEVRKPADDHVVLTLHGGSTNQVTVPCLLGEVVVVQPRSAKTIEVQVVVPVEDMSALGESTGPVRGGSAAGGTTTWRITLGRDRTPY